MTVKVTYQSPNYDPDRLYRRYVRVDIDGIYHFCETHNDAPISYRNYDIRQGTVTADEIPEAIRNNALDQRSRAWPYYVEWPHKDDQP